MNRTQGLNCGHDVNFGELFQLTIFKLSQSKVGSTMKYKITPGNIFCLLLIGYSIYKGHPLPIFLVPIALFGLLIDFVIQVMAKKYLWIVLAEILIILLFLIKII